MRFAGLTRTTYLLAIMLAFVAPGVAQEPSERPLTNADVVKMANAGIPESVIERVIALSRTNFVTTPDALISLKQHQVPDGVLAAIVDSQAGARMRQMDTPAMVYASGPAIQQHHPLPNVDATVRLDGKTTGKLQVRKNEIKVEKAGVPFFDLKWKENAPK